MQNLPRTPNLGVLGKVLSEFFIVGKWLKSAASSIGLTIDDGICFEEFRVADSFNDFFTTIASKEVAPVNSQAPFSPMFIKVKVLF